MARSVWYVCKFCNRALRTGSKLREHKILEHLPELKRLKREKKARRGSLESESQTIRKISDEEKEG